MAAELRVSIIGDDFTPAALFRDALEAALGTRNGSLVFRTLDKNPDQLMPYVSAEVDEAFGDPAEVADMARDAHILVTTFSPVTAEVLADARSLVAIACGRGGPANINLQAATDRGVLVLNTPGRNAQAVAEFTIAAMINLMRQIPPAIDYLRAGRWTTAREDTFEKPSGPELGGKVVGLLGFGQIGRLVARLVKAFGARVLVHDPYVEGDVVARQGVETVDLPRLLAEAQVISVHARLPKGAPPLLGDAQFALMRERPYLVNMARASVLDHDALLRALDAGCVQAAFLDVHPREPVPSASALLTFDPARLLLTPHAAGVSRDVPRVTAQMIADGIAALLNGRTPACVMNPETLETCLARLAARTGP